MKFLSKDKYVIWLVVGGLGKNVAATSLCQDLKTKHSDRKLIILASYPEIFLNNPYVDRVFNINTIQHFYEDYILNKDSIIFAQEAYNQSDHINLKKHLIHSWCDLLEIEYTKQLPQLYFNYAQYKKYSQYPSQKPTLLLQTSGGMFNDKVEYNWTRDIPIEFAQDIVSHFQSEYDIIQVTREGGYKLNGVRVISEPMNNTQLFSLMATTNKRILIDSCLQHAAVSMELPSTVLWVGTNPLTFGYEIHNNILSQIPNNKSHLINSIFYNYKFSENEFECPYTNYKDIFNPDIIPKL